jgi:hypothetical protein
MSIDDYPIIVYHIPSAEGIGHLAKESSFKSFAKQIADRIRQGIDNGTWIAFNGRAIPVEILQFQREKGIIMAPPVTMEKTP